jgi:hypothetical protein
MWTLTSSINGVKDVVVIPAELVPLVEPLVMRGRQYKSALAEMLAINAQLVRLWREQQVEKRSRRTREGRRKAVAR